MVMPERVGKQVATRKIAANAYVKVSWTDTSKSIEIPKTSVIVSHKTFLRILGLFSSDFGNPNV